MLKQRHTCLVSPRCVQRCFLTLKVCWICTGRLYEEELTQQRVNTIIDLY